jgi:N-acetylglucosamine kinase-like BadF-type ATPase
MILVADIGGSKGDWRYIHPDGIQQFQTVGFNPHDHDLKMACTSLLQELKQKSLEPQKVYLYGAGLAQKHQRELIRSAFIKQYEGSLVEVHTDLLGAARSLLGDKPGVACVLGTGAAVCMYDGSQITNRIPPLGHVLGDEGSGFALGKVILQKYLRGHLPDALQKHFESEFGVLSETEVLQNTYTTGGKAYVASFASFMVNFQSDPYVYALIADQFNQFFEAFFAAHMAAQKLRICFTGSIAYFSGNVLQKVARDRNLHVDLITQHPIAGLTLYHQRNG